MKNLDLQVCFEMEVKQLDNLLKANSVDIEYWLNIGLDKFVKTRYSGNNVKGQGFEQSQKRIDDLRTLVSSVEFEIDRPAYDTYTLIYSFRYSGKGDSKVVLSNNGSVIVKENYSLYSITLPENYYFKIGEAAYIIGNSTDWEKKESRLVPKLTTLCECTVDNLTEKLTGALSPHILHRNNAKPLRVVDSNRISLYTDGEYYINKYVLTYIRKPNKIDIHTKPLDEYKDMPEHTHIEIVKLAAQAFFENQSNQRYQTYSNEINTME